MKMKKLFALLLALCLIVSVFAGCGSSESSSAESSEAAEESAGAEEEPEESEEPEEPAEEPEEPAVEEDGIPAEPEQPEESEEPEVPEEAEEPEEPEAEDFTESNANLDFEPYKEMLKTKTTELPITEEPITLSYFLGFETSTLNYIDGGVLENQQVWVWLAENTGISFRLDVSDKTNETDKFNLMIASGDYTDLVPAGDYTNGMEAAYEDEVYVDLGDYLEENMPNYWSIINSDQSLLEDVQDSHMFLAVYPVKDQIANPSGVGTFVRMDWLEDLGMDVPQTYDELTEVLRAFKTEKGASEPMSLFNTVGANSSSGVLTGGFGFIAELSANGMGDCTSGYYQEDGAVIYGATSDGARKYLTWLNQLYNEDLINFENMLARETNPFSDYNAGEASSGETGYIFSNQPFGSEYNTMAAENGDPDCNWWPVQDVAENAGDIIPFYEETSMVDAEGSGGVAITTGCDNIEIALQFLDYGYSYEGSLLYNFGFEIGSGHDVETWYYDESGEPQFDEAALNAVNETTNIASGIISTKDLAGIIFDARLSFSFGERELACFDAWSTNKNTSNILGSSTSLNAEEGTEASAIYSDIITYVSTAALQFINGDLDINDDAAWDDYVANIESMGVADLTAIVQGAYDRANS